MLTETQYNAILESARGFSNISLHYPDYEEHRHYEVLHCGANGVLLAEPARDPSPVHWAANDAAALVSLLSLAPGNITVPFVPREFVAPLTEAGLFVLAEFADFFNLRLLETASALAPRQAEFLNADEAEAAAALSVAVRGQSRGFMGETAQWFRAWMEEGHVLALREDEALAGICCVTVYSGGTTLWVRELAVSPSFQRKGYGRRLMEQALLYGAERGAVKAFLAADLNNANAIALYESCGFSRRGDDTELQMARGNMFQE
ncbi:MAG: GNAT family N-acetyltransferase [Eubacteriales bacterium]|nr:GNAT family N-acetyltransferase [Eubacteriales bacterium]